MPGLHFLPDDLKTEPLRVGERGQVRASQGSVGHVEVLRVGRCSNPHPLEELAPPRIQHAIPVTPPLYLQVQRGRKGSNCKRPSFNLIMSRMSALVRKVLAERM